MRQPLAIQLRPQTIDEIIGQKHLFNENSVIQRMVKTKSLYSLIFYGVPGIGKTSIALALANDLKIPHVIFNAVVDKKEQLIKIIESAK